MVANKPTVIEAGDHQIPVPADLSTTGRGSGRFKAFEFGVLTAMRGHSKDTCPYEANRGSGSFRKQWMRGFDAYHEAVEKKTGKVAS